MKQLLLVFLVGTFMALTLASSGVAQTERIINARDFIGPLVTESPTDWWEWFTWVYWNSTSNYGPYEVETYLAAGALSCYVKTDIYPEVYTPANVPSGEYRVWIFNADENSLRNLLISSDSFSQQVMGHGWTWRDCGQHYLTPSSIITVKAVGVFTGHGSPYLSRRGHFAAIFLTSDCEAPAPDFIPAGSPVLFADVDIIPNVINLKSKGKWITAHVELPNEYDVTDIDIGTVLLNDVIPAAEHPNAIGDHDGDGVLDLMMKFDRAAVYLPGTGDVEIIITGKLTDGTKFGGSDTVRVK